MSTHRSRWRTVLRAGIAVPALAGLTVVPATFASAAGPVAPADWLKFSNGRLVYGHDDRGNQVPDYSYAGYAGGGVAIPKVATKVTVPAPGGGDDTGTIQAAIDKVSALTPDAQGFRGAVQLAAGQYHLAGSLTIAADGVVLRGAGSDASGTTLVATGATARTLVNLGGKSGYTVQGPQLKVTDDYVPVGATVLNLSSTEGLAVGSEVVVERPTTQAWIDAVGMNGTWTPGWSLRSERRITAIAGNRVTLDAPLTTALEKQYTQSLVYRYGYPRISRVGIEDLGADGQAMTKDPSYATTFYHSTFSHFGAVQDGWVTNVFTHHFGQDGVTGLGPESRRISVLHTGALDMVTNTATSARSDGYTLQGQQNLVQDCTLTAAKIHAFVTEARQSGPNVFSRCTATTTGDTYDSGGHQRWGSGTLYDNLTIQGSLDLVNNGGRGTGHGWSDANSTAWNCTVERIAVQSPPGAHNWAFGTKGTPDQARHDGELVSTGTAMTPASLYEQQLAERGVGAPAPSAAPTRSAAPVPAAGTPAPSATTAGPSPTTSAPAKPSRSATSASASSPAARKPEESLASTGSELGAELSLATGALLVGAAAIGLTKERRRRGRHSA
ncbi:peptidoglycan-binding protein [Kitasatospora sp. NPDC094015]|uniref:peptidoglycan-binding protein n=1 Tax=Kitasatospora sp. NPDC094015 TaxID=3155205 RepID=UPI003330091D